MIKIPITTEGIIKILKIAEPTTVPSAALIPSTPSLSIIKNKRAVKNSGRDDPIAFIDAPLTPSGSRLPSILDPVENILQDHHMMADETKTMIKGMAMPNI